jgi:hypothetical protein
LSLAVPLYLYASSEEPIELETQEEVEDAQQILDITLAKLEELQRLEWESLSNHDKIVRLAEKHGVNVSLALNIACAESMFIGHAQNPTSSAGGVFQWIDSSWARMTTRYYGYVEEKMNPDKNIEISILVLRDYGSSDWNASKHEGVGGGWSNKPYERGLCPKS